VTLADRADAQGVVGELLDDLQLLGARRAAVLVGRHHFLLIVLALTCGDC
jgi:hypothetical protein